MELKSDVKIQKNLKKVIKETKSKKEKLLIEQKIVESRFISLFESNEQIKNFDKLPQSKKFKLSYAIIQEVAYLDENQILNEQLGEFLSKLFGGNLLKSAVETFMESYLDDFLEALGLSGYFKNFMVTFLTRNPMEIVRALKDCKAMTSLITEALVEAIFKMMGEEKGLEGGFYGFIRNALGGAIRGTEFKKQVDQYIGKFVCGIYDKVTAKAGNMLQKVNTPSAQPTAAATTVPG